MKKSVSKEEHVKEEEKIKDKLMHPFFAKKPTFGQRAADRITKLGGSWSFIFSFLLLIVTWIFLNAFALVQKWDPFPFILLNLALSMVAAIQAPVILMSQNRQSEKDRIRAEYDYSVNRRAAREIEEINKQLDKIERKLNDFLPKKKY